MAVYTPLSQAEISAFLQGYDIGELISFKGIAEGVENTNYLLVVDKQGVHTRYILTLYEQRVNAEDLPFFLGLTQWLADRDIVCPRPVLGNDGNMVYAIKGKSAAIIEFLEGQGSPHITPNHMTLVGNLQARMQLAAEGFAMTRRNTLSLEGWKSLFAQFASRADEITPGLGEDMQAELEFLEVHWPSGLPSGIVHADIFPDNVFFVDGFTDAPELSGVIDFYFACQDFWVYDLMITMNAWCFDAGHHFVPERAQALVQAYEKVRPISDEEKKSLPLLGRGACMRFLVTRANDYLHQVDGALVNPKDPMEYVQKLYFHRAINDWQDYGIF